MMPAPDGGKKPEHHAGKPFRASRMAPVFVNALIRVLAKEEYGDF